jgi:hypothetical protein
LAPWLDERNEIERCDGNYIEENFFWRIRFQALCQFKKYQKKLLDTKKWGSYNAEHKLL